MELFITEKELRKKAVGNNVSSNILLSLKILFDLISQVLLVYLISSLIAQDIAAAKVKYIFLAMFASFILKGVFYYCATKVAHEKAYKKLTELRLDIIGYLKKFFLEKMYFIPVKIKSFVYLNSVHHLLEN